MGFRFKGEIYIVGINPCVDVPERITSKMQPHRGYIPVTGEINKHTFQQTLVAVKNGLYRLYVNRPMMAGAGVNVGDMATFIIEQNQDPEVNNVPMNALLKVRLKEKKLTEEFNKFIPSRQKEINRYLNYLKTEEALERNVEKVVSMLGKKV